MSNIQNTIAPNLPAPSVTYDPNTINIIENALRLYFKTVDNAIQLLIVDDNSQQTINWLGGI